MSKQKAEKARVAEITLADFEQIEQISEEAGLSQWSIESFSLLLKNEDTLALSINENSEIIGFIIMRLITNQPTTNNNCQLNKNIKNVHEAEILQIATKNTFRNKGFGQILLKRSLLILSQRGCRQVWLEVRTSNVPARKLYLKNNFEIVSVRKDYYTTPRENALILKLDLTTDYQ